MKLGYILPKATQRKPKLRTDGRLILTFDAGKIHKESLPIIQQCTDLTATLTIQTGSEKPLPIIPVEGVGISPSRELYETLFIIYQNDTSQHTKTFEVFYTQYISMLCTKLLREDERRQLQQLTQS